MEIALFAQSPVGVLVPIKVLDARFGTLYEHVAFVPHPLPDEVEADSGTWKAVIAAHKALARLDQAALHVENPQMLRQPSLRREAQSTSALEGTFAPLDQVLVADAREGKRTKELDEVMNYVDAANFAFDRLAAGGRLGVNLLESVHEILVRGTSADNADAGRVRSGQVAIGSPTGSVEDSRFIPMPPGAALKANLDALIRWIEDSDVDPIMAAALAHYQFETLHPFNDGNGRIGRLLIVLQLMSSQAMTEPLLTVSPWFEARREEYQHQLSLVSQAGDWPRWIRFFAEGLAASAHDTADRIARMISIEKMLAELLVRENLSGLARDIVGLLPASPILTTRRVGDRFNKTTQAAGDALKKLEALGVLKRIESVGKGGYRYLSIDVLRALTAPLGNVPRPDDPLSFME